jgi:hypothetical protein
MRPVDQTVKALSALAIALAKNQTRMSEQMRESLTEAVHKTVMERPAPTNGHNNERTVNADTISNSR